MKFQLCQQDSATGNKERNLKKMEEMIANNPGDFHVFPELNITGYYMKDEVSRLAEPLDGPSLKTASMLAVEHGTNIVCGMPILEKDHNLRNAAILLTPEGDIFPYFKSYLPNFLPFEEKLYFRECQDCQPVFPTSFGKVGLLICYDIFYPEVCLNYARQGVDLLACISASPTISRKLFETMAPARAIESTAFFAYVNTVGSEEKLNFWGGAQLYSPRGGLIKRGPYFEEAVVEIDVDPAELKVARSLRPVLRDRNFSESEEKIC